MPMQPQFTPTQIADAARRAHTNADAGACLGIHPNSFGRLCRRYKVETPNDRRRRLHPKKPQDRTPVAVCDGWIIARRHIREVVLDGVHTRASDCCNIQLP